MSVSRGLDFEDEPPTAVRDMHRVLKGYKENAEKKIKSLRDTWRKASPSSEPPAPAEDADVTPVDAVETDEKEKSEPPKKIP